MSEHLYDPESEKLARYFLADEPNVTEANVISLAFAIQSAVEDWFESDTERP